MGKFGNAARRIAAHLVLTIDISTPVGKLTFTVLGPVAELERSLIVEPVRDGSATPAQKAGGPVVALRFSSTTLESPAYAPTTTCPKTRSKALLNAARIDASTVDHQVICDG